MSELISTTGRHNDFRWHLLATASVIGLIGSSLVQSAWAEDQDRPVFTIELGGQLEHVGGAGDRFIRPYMLATPTPTPFTGEGSPISAQRPARYSVGGEINLSFKPHSSDWLFSAGLKYGRSVSKRYTHQQTLTSYPLPAYNKYLTIPKFADNTTRQSESHAVMDFQAGRDVGVGLFGRESSSVVAGGVRFAQFTSEATATLYARPLGTFYPGALPGIPAKKFPTYFLQGHTKRSFSGVGPALSWDNSMPLVGNNRAGEVSFDWGVNGALLFGRQKASIHHETLHRVFSQKYFVPDPVEGLPYHTTQYKTIYHHTPPDQSRSHSVVVPNLGFDASVSYKVETFKATLGYRADFFFGAMDAGIDVRHAENFTTHGPFLNFSIGL